MPETKSRKIALQDTRKVSGATGLPIQTPRTGEYDFEVIANIVKAAKDEGVDPYTALAIALQETKMGEVDANIGQVNFGKLESNPKRLQGLNDATTNASDDVYRNARSLAFMLKASQEDADAAGFTQDKFDEAQRLQAYNGYGKIGANNDVGAKQLYGIDLTKNVIDMAKTPLYGKTIVDVRDNIIKTNPEINDLVNAYNVPAEEMKGLYSEVVPATEGKVKVIFKKEGKVVSEIETEKSEAKTSAGRAAYLRGLYLKSLKNTNLAVK